VPNPQSTPQGAPQPDGVATVEHGWKVVLHNDDVTPFDIVILGLQMVCGLSEEVAEMVAMEAHNEGSAVAKRGLGEDEAEALCLKLRALTRIPKLCPGVSCHHEHDD
jgi:ATP-dependent Clp protease adapter protein ClpS